ncbi:hypothetical protein [Streptomyces violascens]|uniref:Integral membrane protein n=1 Tax=Streptomyces violascens TaxID=67381 RepID=A0ABQ3QKT3_9ACTN|nr:hypothetical protein [Streptomyces violascens]GGT92653.1 hypothetical protein GCM10010289_10740 [Streptomyces violascens]GHI37877.1 hypothetical protein Sviol_22850 [Streptomyces violascens]
MNVYASLLRTGVPAAVGWLVAVALRHGLELDETAVTGVLTPVATFVYYGVFRLAGGAPVAAIWLAPGLCAAAGGRIWREKLISLWPINSIGSYF